MTVKRRPARTYLLWLIAVAVLPVWAFAAILLFSFASSEQAAVRSRAVEAARSAALAVERELADQLVALDGLARSAAAERGDMAALRDLAARMVADTRKSIAIVREDGSILLSTGASFAVPFSAKDLAELKAGRARVTDVFIDARSGPCIAVAKTILIGGQSAIASIAIPTKNLENAIVASAPDQWVLGVGDRIGVYVTRSQRHDDVSGKPGLPEYLAKAVGDHGTFFAENQFGQSLLAGYVRTGFTGWLFSANVPADIASAPYWRTVSWIIGLAASALAVSLLLSYLVGRILSNDAVALAERAAAIGNGVEVLPLATRLHEFALVDAAFAAAQSSLLTRTKELDAVLEAAPVAIWFTHDPAGLEVIRNRRAAEMMGVPSGQHGTFEEPQQVITTRAFQDGREVSRNDRPLTRAMRGEITDHQEYEYLLADGSRKHLLSSARPIFAKAGNIVGAVQISVDISDRKRGEEQRRLLTRELAHRVKNNLAIVQSLVQQTLRNAPSLDYASGALLARLRAFSAAHDILLQHDFKEAGLQEIVEKSPLQDLPSHRFSYAGPDAIVGPSVALAIALSLHELMTNAIKYGALSNDDGTVELTWSLSGPSVEMTWKELGGPPVKTRRQSGFGSRMLDRLASAEGGESVGEYAQSGVSWRLRFPTNGA